MEKNGTRSLMDNAKKINDGVMKLGRNAYLVGLGAFAIAEDEARRAYDRVLTRGETFEHSERNLIGKATERARDLGREVEHRVNDTVSASLHRAGVPSRDEIHTLIGRVEQLTLKIDRLSARAERTKTANRATEPTVPQIQDRTVPGA